MFKKILGFMLAIGVMVGVWESSQVMAFSTQPMIDGGDYHALALKSDGTVWAWGNNREGELGNGTTADRNQPVKVSNLENAVSISVGQRYGMALKQDGTVWTWGDNSFGQLGNGTTEKSYVPVQFLNSDGSVFDAVANSTATVDGNINN